jgi:hypothetical protein
MDLRLEEVVGEARVRAARVARRRVVRSFIVEVVVRCW